MTPERVAVAMSGGVDSAVAAALLVEQGVDVFGVMLRLWVEDGRINRCCSPDDVAAARRTAGLLEIPFFVLDMQDRFRDEIVTFFLDGYANGGTPNPCIECNRRIRWTHLLGEARALGATHLATGHYARVEPENGKYTLLRALDHDKDQSYVLSILGQEQLGHARFPLGRLTKAEVRDYARRRSLPVAERPESQDLCFLAGQDYRDFLRTHANGGFIPGPIVGPAGEVLGQHAGLADYTIGQRKGLGIPSNTPLYVLAKDARYAHPGGRAARAPWAWRFPDAENQLGRWRPTRSLVRGRGSGPLPRSARARKDHASRIRAGPRRTDPPGGGCNAGPGGRFLPRRRLSWRRDDRVVNLPAIYLGFLTASLLAAGFHALRGGTLAQLGLYLVTAWVAFPLGHGLAAWMGWEAGQLGSLRLLPAVLATLVGLLAASILAGPRPTPPKPPSD